MSNLLNKKYHIELEVLSPLHIGAGGEKDWMKGADYIEDNGFVYVLDHKKVAKQITPEVLTSFLINKDDNGLKKKLSGNLQDVSNKKFKSPVDSSNDIKTFIKNGLTNQPIVPGSSLKGAIRSILFSYLREEHQKDDKQVFGSPNKGDEFMRFIKIADAQFENTELINTKIFNLFGTAPNFSGGWKKSGHKTNPNYESNGFNTIYEIIEQNETGELSIAYSEKTFDNFIKENRKTNNPIRVVKEKEKKEILENDNLSVLFKIINNHTKKYINKQIAFFEKYSNNETPNIIKNLKEITKQISEDNSSCILKMSAGSGFHSITGDWQFDDYSIDRLYSEYKDKRTGVIKRKSRGNIKINNEYKEAAKSRKIAIDNDNFYLMGFVKLSLLSDELIAQREQERLAKIEEEYRIKAEQIAKVKAEQERAEAEKQAEIEAKQKIEAEQIAKEKAKREAIEKREKEQAELLLKSQEANKEKRASEIEKIISKGLINIKLLNDFNKGKTIIETYFKALNNKILSDEIQISLLKEFLNRCIEKSNKRWKKAGKQDWTLVKKWVGADTAQQWYNEIIKK